jgi:hypothetical protein
MNDKTITEISKILTKWNPLGPRATSIPDLDDYQTEAIDILMSIEINPNSDFIAAIVRDVMNQAFDLSLDLKDCAQPAKEIGVVLKK